MSTPNSFKPSHLNGKASAACLRSAARRPQRFTTEEDGRVEYAEFFLRFVMLACLLCTLAICLVHITTPASVSSDEATAATATTEAATTPNPIKKVTPAVTVRISLPGGFHF